jgi:hypothetical protein
MLFSIYICALQLMTVKQPNKIERLRVRGLCSTMLNSFDRESKS